MAHLQEDSEWKDRWNERGLAIHRVLGETIPPGTVKPFFWRDYTLPGACALEFGPKRDGEDFLYMTLGLTQSLRSSAPAFPWELSVRTRRHEEWPIDLLYQLVTQWLCENGDMGFGYHLPFAFFTDRSGKLWSGVSDEISGGNVVGTLRGLYLWTDDRHLSFKASSGDFGLLTVVGVTEDEDRLARLRTPAHLMLLLRRMGIGQRCDPFRRSVLALPGAATQWRHVEMMSHDDALDELQRLA